LNNIPLVSEGFGTAPAIPWATLTGQVTSVGTGVATAADITFSALQDATPTGGSVVHVTIPVFSANAQPPTFETTATPTPATPACPMATDCLNYSLVVPASNLSVGTFASGAITYAAPASGTVNYSLLAESADCTASAPSPALVTPIAVTPATTTTVSTIPAFSGCTAPM